MGCNFANFANLNVVRSKSEGSAWSLRSCGIAVLQSRFADFAHAGCAFASKCATNPRHPKLRISKTQFKGGHSRRNEIQYIENNDEQTIYQTCSYPMKKNENGTASRIDLGKSCRHSRKRTTLVTFLLERIHQLITLF